MTPADPATRLRALVEAGNVLLDLTHGRGVVTGRVLDARKAWRSAVEAAILAEETQRTSVDLSDACIVDANTDFSCVRLVRGCTRHPRLGAPEAPPSASDARCMETCKGERCLKNVGHEGMHESVGFAWLAAPAPTPVYTAGPITSPDFHREPCVPAPPPVAASGWQPIAERVQRIAEKQANALGQGWSHAVYCNYQRLDIPKCNCGLADLQQLARDLSALPAPPPEPQG